MGTKGHLFIRALAAAALAVGTLLAQPDPALLDKPADPLLQGMKYRLIGPFRGGRSLTVSGVAGDPGTYYFGGVGGGIWKSTDGAITWSPVFDKEGSSALGSLAVAPSDPNVIYAGTGEACLRNNIIQGDGVYKSLDAGKTWTNVGLRDSRAIGKILIHPRDPNVVLVAALGHPYAASAERGVFRTTDGGKTWRKVLYKDENTGAIDLAFDPGNPNIVFAALWQVRRTAYSLSSGGPGSGLYRSGDGGATWKQVEGEGLPPGPWGRVGVAVSADSGHIYALIQAAAGGLYRSDDGGEKWELVNSNFALIQRAWYFTHIFTDPKNADTVYILNVQVWKSTDGGRSFNQIKSPHPDNHALWIAPDNPQRMILGNDGGATVTRDGGKTWSQQYNQPTAQFYHVVTDTHVPYRVYGSQQDNSSVAIASRSDSGSIGRPDWYPVGGGEAGYIAPYPPDPDIVYAADYEGTLTRFDKRTGQAQSVSPWQEATDGEGAARLAHRFQWTAPLVVSPHDPNVLYFGGEVLFKTTDAGVHWQIISPDLTRNDKSKQASSGGSINHDDSGAEYYDTIFTIAESPLTSGLIWVGTDDGLIQVTADGGKNWRNMTPPELPEWSRISLIEASPQDARKAYVAVDRHELDDLHPYIYKTMDFGRTWSRITQGIPDDAFVRAIREDPRRVGLLYAGTEKGVFVSFDDGAAWRPLQLNLPNTPVHDLVVTDNDLVLATHGRAFWILDDVQPLREFQDRIAQEDVHLYLPAPAYRYHSGERPEKPVLVGENPPDGAIIDFYLKAKPKGETTLEILDATGAPVRTYSSSKFAPLEEPPDPDAEKPKPEIEPEAGLNRFVWDLHYDPAPAVPGYYLFDNAKGARGPMALPGHYQVQLTVDGKKFTAPLEVKLDPRVKIAPEDLQKQFTLLLGIHRSVTRVYQTVNQMRDVRQQLKDLRQRLPATDAAKRISAQAEALDQKIAALEGSLIDLRLTSNEASLAYPLGLDAKLAALTLNVGGVDAAPTESQIQTFQQFSRLLDEQLTQWSAFLSKDLISFEKLTDEQHLHAIVPPQ